MRRTSLLLALLLLPSPARAAINPNPLFTDGMVLQRGKDCKVWGTATPGEVIAYSLTGAETSTAGTNVKADKEGKWSITLPAMKAGGPYTLTLKGNNTVTIKDILVGDVWVCSGQSNMEWPMHLSANAKKDIAAANHPKIRLFTVQKATSPRERSTVVGRWEACTPGSVSNFSAVAYFFGRDLHKKLDVPIGLINTSWGGTVAEAWASRKKLEATASLKYFLDGYDGKVQKHDEAQDALLVKLEAYIKEGKRLRSAGKELPPVPALTGTPFPPYDPNIPTVLYNAMIKPLQPFAIKGAIWYQGESNADRAYEYRTLFPAMIQSWRDDWKQGDFPFLFVQLAPWLGKVKEPQESAWAELREAQALTAKKVKNTGMAVITDVGDPVDIHPRQKEPVGARLALAARAIAYGEKIIYAGPEYDSHKVKDGKVILKFTSVGLGLEAKGGALTGFTIAGKDKKFVNANAVIAGDTVVVSAADVKEPFAVRYGWYNCPEVNLWNKDGLPASPFRTDSFRGVTWPKPK